MGGREELGTQTYVFSRNGGQSTRGLSWALGFGQKVNGGGYREM
jgi:hypothetical protein